MKEKKIRTIGAILSFTLLIGISILSSATNLIQNTGYASSTQGSVYTWQDDFDDTSKIDQTFSYSFQLEDGTTIMQNTYPAWLDPSFTRMKTITITNSGQETISSYVVNLTVLYESDMHNKFYDLRFTNSVGSQHSYCVIKKIDGVFADVLVKIPTLPPGETTIYMFYGNPTASSQSNFDGVFTWKDRDGIDITITIKAYTEGTWDPDVEWGGGRFLVAWEERVGPENRLYGMERTFYSPIHGRTYNITGGDPYPTGDNDIKISAEGVTDYHAQNPSIAFGDGKFFVVWEQNPATIIERYEADIKGAIVSVNGAVTSRFTICSADNGQFDPRVAYDTYSERFLVVWEDARNGWDDYNVYGRLYNKNGFPIAADFLIAGGTYFQGEPAVSSNNQGNFLVVYEHGISGDDGPFSLFARTVSHTGVVGSQIPIVTGTSSVDNIFPTVSYNPKTDKFLVTWNTADISSGTYKGSILGKFISISNTLGGEVLGPANIVIQSGTSFICSKSVPFFDSMFLVTYDGPISGTQNIYGRVISSEGELMTPPHGFTDGSTLDVGWNSLAVVGNGRVFSCWEDGRDLLSEYPDVCGYVSRIVETIGSSDITYAFGAEKTLILESRIVSITIAPDDLHEWDKFQSVFSTPTGTTLVFDILDETGYVVLKSGVISGENISSITADIIRLRATLSRLNPSKTPALDLWNVTAIVGTDLFPPTTTIEFDPATPDGSNGWYISPVTITFNVTDPDSPPENITTYYKINDLNVEVYDPDSPPVLDIQGANNRIEYWSDDSVNEEEHHVVEGIKIDFYPPTITLKDLPNYVSPGLVLINGSATEYTSGSGIERLKLWIGDELLLDTIYSGEYKIWFDYNFTADAGETYDIRIECYDMAGLRGQERRIVTCSDKGVYDVGYFYLFDDEPAGPYPFLVKLGMAIAVNYDSLLFVLKDYSSEAAWVEFVAQGLILKDQFTFVDDNLTDGCSINLKARQIGIYSVKAYVYDAGGNLIQEHTLISKILIVLLKQR
jgi:hypothetical protein